MQNKALLLTYVLAIGGFFVFNSGCNGNKLNETTIGSIAVPVIGRCGTAMNVCDAGTLLDITDSGTEYLWTCEGANGGASASCALAKPEGPAGVSNGVLDDNQYFYVGLDTTDDIIGHVHKHTGSSNSGDFSLTCGINKDTTANEDISCIFEIPEGDLYGKELGLKYNIPPNMCRYLEQETYWFYNYETGYGPNQIQVDILRTVNGSGDITAVTYNCTIDGTAMPCTSHPEITPDLTTTSASFSCIYDHTKEKKPNCCLGDYNVVTNIYNNGSLYGTNTADLNWGGQLGACLGGAAKTSWSAADKDGFPHALLQFVQATGINKLYKVSAPAALNGLRKDVASIHMANYFGDAASHDHTGFINSGDTSTAPYFLEPIDDRDGDAMLSGHGAYEFRCLDAAFEVKHRIRVYVRDWDSFADFTDYVESAGVTFKPDRGSDPEPDANCNGLPLGSSCNDNGDMDDFLTLIVGPILGGPPPYLYDTTDVTKRGLYFPQINY